MATNESWFHMEVNLSKGSVLGSLYLYILANIRLKT